jgi:hypothetical protein
MANSKTTTPTTKTGPRDQGKKSFTKEHLLDHPFSNPAAVNAAWKEAGMTGTVSPSIVSKVRAEMGLTGNLRKGRKPSGATLKNAKAKRTPIGNNNQHHLSRELDSELDRLIFKVMDVKALSDVAESLRDARRALYRALPTKHS